MKPLTKSQAEMLEYIIEFTDDKGHPPTFREVGFAFGETTNEVRDLMRGVTVLRKGKLK